MSYSFMKLAEEVLETAYHKEKITALSPEEIWEKAKLYDLQKKCNSSGKTPWQSIGAQIYVDLKDNSEKSLFVKAQEHPVRFALKKYLNEKNRINVPKQEASDESGNSFLERALHPLLSKFVYSDPHFQCYTKTVYHEVSTKRERGKNKWLHPDIIGVYFPFDSYQVGTLDIIKSFYESKMRLFSFEMKKAITSGNLRECFFQAVSNSSWANEGYLVALKYDSDSDFREEMQRLNNAFGIGFIQLDAQNIAESIVLIPARNHEQIDWDTLDRLLKDNDDVKSFVDSINEDASLQKVKNKSEYDKIMDNDEITKWIKEKKIKV